ncbi:MAG: magnesium/cobalt transporter CorA [Dissulfurispiraceae bacterium]|jgi:magnesium transporter|nr:magnesium/cobalt transporter CorA [Dissulfurispiraceae bacterium]
MSVRKRSQKAGLPPGSLVHVGEKRAEKVRVELFTYDDSDFQERDIHDINELLRYKEQQGVVWINIHGLHDPGIVEVIGKQFELHPLTLEDILNPTQRPKVEDFRGYLFVVLKMLYYTDAKIASEQVGLIIRKNCVLSFQEDGADVFNPIRDQIRSNKGRLRRMGADYLAYALIDNIVDNYFVILENMSEAVDMLEDEVTETPGPDTLQTIHFLRRELIMLRKSVWPLREVINRMQHEETEFITENTRIYLRDVYDHTIQVIDSVETLRDTLSGMLDVYLSSVSNRLNQIMKVLTIIATIFMPLTFISGLYGMNFKNMPELVQWWGYPAVLLLMSVIAGSMIYYFKRKKWF